MGNADTTRTIKVDSILVKGKLRLDKGEDIDTGMDNGSGEFTVRAASAKNTKNGVLFSGVEIEVSNPEDRVPHGYFDRDDKDLIEQAEYSLEADYTV